MPFHYSTTHCNVVKFNTEKNIEENSTGRVNVVYIVKFLLFHFLPPNLLISLKEIQDTSTIILERVVYVTICNLSK